MTEAAVERCKCYRRRILDISRQVPAAHIAPAFSCVEIVDTLYHCVMRKQDVFIMSKGHGCLAQYVVLEDLGVLTRADLDAYCQPGGHLGAHPDYDPTRGIHASTGSLGHGLGIAAGQALAERLKGTDARVYVLLSDGECQEGSTWEAAMVAANLRLGNLVAVVNANDWGGMDSMTASHPQAGQDALRRKFDAFGWATSTFDGHDQTPSHDGRTPLCSWLLPDYGGFPRAAVCLTVKGKGVSFVEDGQPLWHYRSPNEEEYEQAVGELADG